MTLFIHILNIGVTAGWLALAVMVIRLFRIPKWIRCILWGIVGVRLMVPFHWQSPLSLIPSAEVIPANIGQNPAIQSGIPAVNGAINPVLTQQTLQGYDPVEAALSVGMIIWLTGMGIMILYSLISCLVLRIRLRQSVKAQGNVRICDRIDTPFVFGVIRPKIYLPSGMVPEQMDYVLAHERAHIQRHDHWWKPLGYLLLTVYWFHPLLWVAYILLCRDIESACDEKVIAAMGASYKKAYSQALLACSVHRRMILCCPVAFGELSVKSRVKAVLGYKKPAFWITAASCALCVAVVLCFLTDPIPCVHQYEGHISVAATCTEQGVQTHECALCRYRYSTSVEQLPHSYDEGTVTQAPTCTHTGVLTIRCADCPAQITESIERTEHIPGEPYGIKEPDCTHTGEKTATCTGCGIVFVTEVLATNDVHDLHETVVREATCTAEGEGVRECSRCDYSETCVYEKTPHAFRQSYFREATCMFVSMTEYRCVNCNEFYGELGQYRGDHKWVSNGNGTKCSYCGMPKYDDYDMFSSYTPEPSVPELPVIRWDVAP